MEARIRRLSFPRQGAGKIIKPMQGQLTRNCLKQGKASINDIRYQLLLFH
jgi:hypothetical protein